MTTEDKRLLLEGVSIALDNVVYGKIILECRGPTKPVDLIVENRTRYTLDNSCKNKGGA